MEVCTTEVCGIQCKIDRRWKTKVPVNNLVASVAQLVEQLTLNQLVVGSNPPRGTILFRFILLLPVIANT